jgi:hypothetical protein
MTREFEICKIEDMVKVAKTLSFYWFRGHDKTYNNLLPKIYRSEYLNGPRIGVDQSILERFKLSAPSLMRSKIPKWDDDLAWLFLMQHYGAPTRLLDWTKNSLVALFFAVGQEFDSDGELWAMFPKALNEHSMLEGHPIDIILRWDDPIINKVAHNHADMAMEEIRSSVIAKELEKCELEGDADHRKLLLTVKDRIERDIPKYPLAFIPQLDFPRMFSQQSVFTIHPDSGDGSNIEDVLNDRKKLIRYIIPKEYKYELLQDLRSLGITRSTLFGDLDALCSDLCQEVKMFNYIPSLKEPPCFDEVHPL